MQQNKGSGQPPEVAAKFWQEECDSFRNNSGAFHFLAHEVLDCVRVKVRRSLQHRKERHQALAER